MISKAGIKPFFKLEKLKIEAYTKKERTQASRVIGADFEAMFNPEAFTQTFNNNFAEEEVIEGSPNQIEYTSTAPRKLNFKLIVDDTGVTDYVFMKTGSFSYVSLTDRVQNFLTETACMDGDLHEPRFLKVKWGSYTLDCRIQSLNVRYTLFDRGGNALRAELDIAFIEDIEPRKSMQETKPSSPDLTHIQVVEKGDTLPMMCNEIYGTTDYYIQVAQYNKLNNFRKLEPGMEIYFPPVEK